MKKLIIFTVAILALQVSAQEQKSEHSKKNERQHNTENISAENIATLQTKRMTLHLDLNNSQQAEIMKINLENAIKRKAMMAERKAKKESGETRKLTPEQHFKMVNARLDHKIEMKAKMKNILNQEQFSIWEKAQMRNAKKGKHKKRYERNMQEK